MSIPAQCLFKSESIGSQVENFSQPFDQTDDILKSLTTNLMPYAYSYCNDQNSRLISVQMTFADPNNTSDFVRMPKAGPNGGTCKNAINDYGLT